MGHLDKRMDPDNDVAPRQSGTVKDGVSGNVSDTTAYEQNKTKDLPDGPAPDVIQKHGPTTADRKG